MEFIKFESFLAAKSGIEQENEDIIQEGSDWIVVCDGATDKAGYTIDGVTGGRIAAQVVANAVSSAITKTSAHQIIHSINSAYIETFGANLPNLENDRPSCSFAALDKKEGTLIRVGDVGWSDGKNTYDAQKQIDVIHSTMRAAYLQMLLIDGKPVAELLEIDPGRELILASLRKQAVLRNREDGGPLAFGAVDGNPIPARFIETWKLGPDVTEVVIATDGYPFIKPTLRESEEYLRADIQVDPLRIGIHKTTKCVKPGNQSFDDRAYVSLRRGEL